MRTSYYNETLTTIFIDNLLYLLKNKVKHYVKIYYKYDSVTVEIVDYKTLLTYSYQVTSITFKILNGYTSHHMYQEVLNDYKHYVLNLYFNWQWLTFFYKDAIINNVNNRKSLMFRSARGMLRR